jgi:P-type E1-E2 ATPase
MRNGKEEEIHHDFIHTGDLIKIEGGKNIPVDGIIVNCVGLQNNESAMTGEPDELKKDTIEVCK